MRAPVLWDGLIAREPTVLAAFLHDWNYCEFRTSLECARAAVNSTPRESHQRTVTFLSSL